MKKKFKCVVDILLVISMVLGLCADISVHSVKVKAADYKISNPRRDEYGVSIWDKIKFGHYSQTSVGFEKSKIKWRILDIDGDDAFLISDQIMDAKPYHTDYEAVTWETSSLRSWLNNDFYNAAFDDAQKAAIKQTTVINKDSETGIEGGNDTLDKVYLPSREEMEKYAYGFQVSGYKWHGLNTRITDYARNNGLSRYSPYIGSATNYEGFGFWWLRSPGYYEGYADYAYEDSISSFGRVDSNYGVRPVLHVSISSDSIMEAGTVSSAGEVKADNDGKYNEPIINGGTTTWDCVYFGEYFQTQMYQENEPIEWRVLSVDGDDAFILADKALDCILYRKHASSTTSNTGTWETSYLRSWLNNDFYNTAFDETEQSAIKQVEVVNPNNPYSNTKGGSNTQDKIYLLSIEEACNTAYGFDAEFKQYSQTRCVKPTDYAYTRGAFRNVEDEEWLGNGFWWLRSPGKEAYYAAEILTSGRGPEEGATVSSENIGVRPVMHIDLSSLAWSYSGTVRSDGSVSENPEDHEFNDAVYHASYIYDFYKNTDAGMNAYFYSNTPSHILNKEAEDSGLAKSVEAWNTMQNILSAVDDPSNILDKPLEKVDLYEGIIFALFETASEDSNFQGKSIINKANSLMGTLKEDMEKLYGIKISEDSDFSNLTREQKEKLSEHTQKFFKDNKISQTANIISEVSKAVDHMSNLQEYAEYQSNCMAIIEMSESYKNILQEMYDACSLFGNESLKIALLDCISTMNKSEEYLATKMGLCALGVAGKEVAKCGMSELWESVKKDLCVQNPYVALIWVAYKTSNFFCNSVFNTSNIAEKTVKMDAILDVRELAKAAYEKEKAAFTNTRTIENAENYLAAIDVNFNYLNEDCQTASSFVDTVSDALFTKIMGLFGGDNLAIVKKQISSIQRSYALEYFSTQTAWIYGLEEDYPAEYDNYAYLLDESWKQIKERYHIACPVDIYIYGASGELLASVENNKVFCREEAPVTLAVSGDEKEIWFYKDLGQYTVQYVGTDNGLMDISIEVYNEAGDIVRKVKHIDIPLTEGIMYSSQGDIESENCTYELKESNGIQMQPIVDTFDQNLQKYTLTINNGYIVSENYVGYMGEFYAGEKVTIYANMPNGAEFTDWKADVVSNDIFDNPNSKIVTVVMPATNMVLTATDNRNILIENISLKVSDTIKINEKIQLEALVSPNTATNKALKWKTDNDSVAIVDDNGLVTALAEGTVTITVESMDGSGISASCVITVERVSDNPTDESNGNANGDNTSDESNGNTSGDLTGDDILDGADSDITGEGSSGGGSTGNNPGNSPSENHPDAGGSPSGGSSGGNPSGGSSGGTTGSNSSGGSTGNDSGNSPSENHPDDGNNGELQVKLLYYIVDFNANGGNSLSRKTMTLLMDDTLGILPKIQRKQYDFKGWYTQKSGGEKVTQATVLNVSTTLYAQWAKTAKSAKPAKLSLTEKKGKQMKVSYKKVSGVSGYQIAYSTSKKFASSATKKVTTASTSKVLKNLKKGKTYYVRVRAYKTDSAGNRVFGTYSGKKSIKIKA